MIDNPQNVFEELQNDVAAKLMATAPFNAIKFPDGSTFRVLTEDEGDIQFEFDTQIAQLGLSLVVHAPTGRIDQPDLPGPLITKLGFDVWVSEAPVFNRSADGTQVRLMKATTIVLGTLHGFQPDSIGSPIYCDEFRTERERTYESDQDKVGTLIITRICHFIAPQVAAAISSSGPDILLGTFRPADVNAGADLINFPGLTNGDEIRFARSQPNNNLPSPIVEDQFYFVVGATLSWFQISVTQGGPVLPINNSGTGNNNQIWKRSA